MSSTGHSLQDISGVGEGTAQKLKDAGYGDVISVARSSARTLEDEVTGMGEDGAQNTIDAARELLREGSGKFKTGKEVEKAQDELSYITTGSEDLDELLNGGIPSKYTVENYGQFSSGKTQLSHQLAVNVQLPEDEGGMDKGAVFIDTEETFRADRIRQMAEANGQDPDEVLDNIYVTRPEDGSAQEQAIKEIPSEIDMEEIGIVIVDSVMAHFRSEYSGRGELSERQDRLGSMLKGLRDLASGYDVAVFYTNQAYEDPGKMFGDPVSATGGNVVKHNCVAADSLVIEDEKGIVEISEIEEGDKVHNGEEFVKVRGKSTKSDSVKRIKNNTISYASKDHRYPTKEGVKKVSELQEGDKIEIPDNIDIETRDLEIETSEERLVIISEKTREDISESLRGNFKGNNELESYVGMTNRQIRRVKNQGYPTQETHARNLIEYALDRDATETDYTLKNTNKYRNNEFPSKIDGDLAYLYGAWFTDGTKPVDNRVEIRDESKEWLEYISNLVDAKSKIEKIDGKNCYQLHIYSTALQSILKEIHDKRDKLIFCGEDELNQFIAAMFDGDGSINQGTLSFNQANERDIKWFHYILQRMGIYAKLSESASNGYGGRTEMYELRVSANHRYRIIENMNHSIKTERWSSENTRSRKQYREVMNIEDVEGERELVDISVEGNYFLCNTNLTHNSSFRLYSQDRGSKGWAMEVVDSPMIAQEEARFDITEEGIRDA